MFPPAHFSRVKRIDFLSILCQLPAGFRQIAHREPFRIGVRSSIFHRGGNRFGIPQENPRSQTPCETS